MTHRRFSRRLFFLVAPLFYLALACTSSMHGKYSDSRGLVTIDFKSGHKAFMTTVGSTTEVTYRVEDSNVILESPAGNMVMTREKDGSLTGDFGRLVKRGS